MGAARADEAEMRATAAEAELRRLRAPISTSMVILRVRLRARSVQKESLPSWRWRYANEELNLQRCAPRKKLWNCVQRAWTWLVRQVVACWPRGLPPKIGHRR